jgi:hypothetical protein
MLHNAYSKMPEVEMQVRTLSNGTLATLTGWKDYYSLDCIRQKFMEFVMQHPEQFKNWQEAWNEFIRP